MSGPWEDYQAAPAQAKAQPTPTNDEDGPWNSFKASAEVSTGPEEAGPWNEYTAPKATKSGTLTEEELGSIAKQFGVDKEKLAASAPFLGIDVAGRDKGWSEWAKDAGGFVGESVGMGLPQKLFIESADSPAEKKALQALRDISSERKSGLRTAAEIGTGIGVGIATGSIVGKGAALLAGEAAPAVLKALGLATPAIAGAVTGYGHSKEGEELKDTAIGAGFGLAGQAVFAGLGAAGRKFGAWVAPAADSKSQYMREIIEQGKKAFDEKAPSLEADFRTVLGAVADLDPESMTAKRLAKQMPDLAGFAVHLMEGQKLEKKGVLGAVQEALAKEGPDSILRKYMNYKEVDETLQAAGKNFDTLYARRTGERSAFDAMKDGIRDGLWKVREVDHQLGTNAEQTLVKMAQADNQYTQALTQVASKLGEHRSALMKSGLKNEVLYAALDNNPEARNAALATMSPAQREVVAGFEKGWGALLDAGRAAGLPIQKLEGGYVMHMAVDRPEYLARVLPRLKAAGKELGVDVINSSLDEQAFQSLVKLDPDLVQAVRMFAPGRAVDNAAQFGNAVRTILDPKRSVGSATDAFNLSAVASNAREGLIPDFIREKDVVKLMGRWSQNTFRTAFFKDHIDDLMKIRDKAVAVGNGRNARYLSNLVSDIVGVRPGTFHGATKDAIQRMQTRFLIAGQEASDAGKPLQAKFLNWVADKPNFMPTLLNQVYPNFLGFKPQAVMMNLAQPFMTTLPELGYGYGTPRVLTAYAKVADGIRAAGGFGKYGEGLRAAGVIKAQWNTELKDVLAGAIQKSAPSRLAGKALDTVSDAAMFAFERSEMLNRAMAHEMSKGIAADLMGKNGEKAAAGALLFAKNAGGSITGTLQALAAKGDEKALHSFVTDYLISKTQFNYSRATMNEYGRFMGPMFSVFTKWPAAIAGDVWEQYARRGATRGTAEVARKYGAPLAAMWAIDNMVLPDSEDNKWVNLAVGKGGLTNAAPIGTLGAIATGKILEPPVISAVKTLGIIAKEGPATAFWKTMNKMTESFTPGAVLGHTYIRGRDFIEDEASKGTFAQKIAGDTLDIDDSIKEIDDNLQDSLEDIKD